MNKLKKDKFYGIRINSGLLELLQEKGINVADEIRKRLLELANAGKCPVCGKVKAK